MAVDTESLDNLTCNLIQNVLVKMAWKNGTFLLGAHLLMSLTEPFLRGLCGEIDKTHTCGIRRSSYLSSFSSNSCIVTL